MGLVHISQSASTRICVPIRGRNVRSLGSKICCSCWCRVQCPGHDCLLDRTRHEHLHLYVCLSSASNQPSLTKSRWNDLGRCWCGHQRIDGFGCDIRTCPNCKARKIRCSVDFHHHPILPSGSLGSIDCLSCELEICWSTVWCLGFHRACHDSDLLPSSSPSQLQWFDQQRDHGAGRLRRRVSFHIGHDSVYGMILVLTFQMKHN